jgi:hypothetical protein
MAAWAIAKAAGKFWKPALVVAVLLALAVPPGIIKFGQSRAFSEMTPHQKAVFNEWYFKKVTIPPELLRVKEFSLETVQAVRAFERQWAEHKKATQALENDFWKNNKDALPTTVSDEFIASHKDQINGLEPFLVALKAVVLRPDYDFDAWDATQEPSDMILGYAKPDFKAIRSAIRLAYLNAMIELKQGRLKEAGDDAGLLAASAQMNASSTSINREVSNVLLKYGIAANRAVLDQAKDPALKKAMVDYLKSLRARLRYEPMEGVNPLVWDDVGMTAEARRHGLTLDIRDKTGYQVMIEVQRVRADYIDQIVLPQITDPAKRKEAAKMSALFRDRANAFEPPRGLARLLGRWTEPVNGATLFAIAMPGFEKAEEIAKETLAQYDQLIAAN